MTMFAKDQVSEKILGKIEGLSKDVAELRGERDAVTEELKLSDDVVRLKRQLTNLEIEKDKKDEENQRKVRDVEHKVGLERKRQEFEVDSAKRDTQLTIREENLAADRDRFEQHMEFMSKRFESEVGYLKELMSEVLDRLPHVKVDKRLTVGAAINGNGDGDDDDE